MSPLASGCILLSEGQAIELTVTYLGGVQFEVEARGHKIYSDLPAEFVIEVESLQPVKA